MPNVLTFREVTPGSADYFASLRLRGAVLRAPLGLEFTPAEMEIEPQCSHFAAFENGVVIATLLLLPVKAETVKMRQVAVDPDRQGGGIGAGLVRFAEAAARDRGFREIMAHARETAVPFYLRMGYQAEAGTFLENTIPHRLVRKILR